MASSEQSRREKRTVRETANLKPTVARAVRELAAHEGRSRSTVIERILEKDPSVRIFIERIGSREGRT